MNRKLKKMLPIIILLVVFVGLIVCYVIVKNRPEGTSEESDSVRLIEATNAEINAISYIYGDEAFDFVRDADGNWIMEDEEEFPLDASTLQVMAGCLGSLEADLAVEMNGNLADYGLDNPEIVIIYSAESGETQTLSVGDAYPYGDQRYVSSSNDAEHVYIVTSLIASDFEKTREDLFADITLATDEADVDTGMAYSYIVDYRSSNFEGYGLGSDAVKLTVPFEVSESSEVEKLDEETGETTTETVTEAVAKEAVFYVGNKTEDELYYYVNPEGTDYTVAVSTVIIDSLSAADEMESVE